MPAPAEERAHPVGLTATELRDAWPVLSTGERLEGLTLLTHAETEAVFLGMHACDQADLVLGADPSLQRSLMRMLPPDDAADVVQEASIEDRHGLLSLLDLTTRKEVVALLAYAEDDAGGLMNPRYARLRPEMSVDEAISYLRRQTREHVESVYYLYVLDAEQHLLGVVSVLRGHGTGAVRQLCGSRSNAVRDVARMRRQERQRQRLRRRQLWQHLRPASL